MKIWNKDTGVCELSIRVSSSRAVGSIYPCNVVQLQDGRLVVSDKNAKVFIVER
jgi:hypothetical protein